MFSKILVPVDGSDISYRALDAALFLSEKLGSNITVIHVMEDVPITQIESPKLLTELLEAYKKESQGVLSKCSEIATKKGLTINTILLKGNPASIILDISIKEKKDMVIMGSRGIGKFKELILGSVSSKILHHSSCPVMLIR
ncbi:MAG: universal stress protein [Thaumarchaeota archaeon]|nr:MAG: universal stress protein [Nitrososphaerota archaeon]